MIRRKSAPERAVRLYTVAKSRFQTVPYQGLVERETSLLIAVCTPGRTISTALKWEGMKSISTNVHVLPCILLRLHRHHVLKLKAKLLTDFDDNFSPCS